LRGAPAAFDDGTAVFKRNVAAGVDIQVNVGSLVRSARPASVRSAQGNRFDLPNGSEKIGNLAGELKMI
jgi:hypothetical protein